MTLNVFIDGACRGNPGPASVGVYIQDGAGKSVKEYHRTIGETTNNVAEYTAMIDALRLAGELGGTRLRIFSDSQLLVRQVSGQYRVKNERLRGFLVEIREKMNTFESVELNHVPREQNKRADRLANIALDALKTNS